MTLAYSANFSQTYLANRYCSAAMSSSTCALDQRAHRNDWAAATSCSCLVLGALVSICCTSVSVLRREGDAAAQYGLGFRSVDLAAPVRHPITGENVPMGGGCRASTSTVKDVPRLAGPAPSGMLSQCSRTGEHDDVSRVAGFGLADLCVAKGGRRAWTPCAREPPHGLRSSERYERGTRSHFSCGDKRHPKGGGLWLRSQAEGPDWNVPTSRGRRGLEGKARKSSAAGRRPAGRIERAFIGAAD
jgi:hypothetical protein